ncbi:hypothetical protein E0Y62_25950 [Cytobacillus praedii]|uniref:Uncharacterized protein n=2 Tax=Cytobacillus praedii TaxID=1742358 RepID=A0A4R1AMT7_9BACI|nr:hypothetical protein E0Y62_25950 [Cytobacillus praedii]
MKKFISNDYSNGIIYDEHQDEVLLITKKFTKNDGSFEFEFKKFSSEKINKFEISMDNQTVYKTDRASQLFGTAVGVVALGGIGAIIGGLSGQKNNNEIIKSIQLKLLIDDIDSPSHKISFLSNVDQYTGKVNNGYPKDSSEVRVAIKNIERWQGILEILIKQQNKVVNS